MLSKEKSFSLSKRYCAYDDDFRFNIFFSKLEALFEYYILAGNSKVNSIKYSKPLIHHKYSFVHYLILFSIKNNNTI